MIRVFNFECKNNHITECFVDSDVQQTTCSVCGELASRVMSAPRFKLDGVSGDYPTATQQWERKHVEAAAVANAKYERHGK